MVARTRHQAARDEAVATAPSVDPWDRACRASIWDILAANVDLPWRLLAEPVRVSYSPEHEILYLGIGEARSPVAVEIAPGVPLYYDPGTLRLASIDVLGATRQVATGGPVRALVAHIMQLGHVPASTVAGLREAELEDTAPPVALLADLIRLAGDDLASGRRVSRPQGPR